MFSQKEEKELKSKLKNLEKKELDLIISDFDDTIFCTKEVIEKDYRKWRRWHEWNVYLLENNLIDKVIKECYINKSFPKTIVSKLRINHDLILTKWIREFSIPKIKATWIDKYNYIVTETTEDKISETIRYVINNLWFIPAKITVYEDRPKDFIKHKEYIEDFLWTDIKIMFVEMIDNNTEPKITKIERKQKKKFIHVE